MRVASSGITKAASTSPSRTFAMASSLVSTSTGSIERSSGPASRATSIRCPPNSTSLAESGTRFAKATWGFSGPRESAKPMSVAITIG